MKSGGCPSPDSKKEKPSTWMAGGRRTPERTRCRCAKGTTYGVDSVQPESSVCPLDRRIWIFESWFRQQKRKAIHLDGFSFLATSNGLEPSTSSVTGWRANRLHHEARTLCILAYIFHFVKTFFNILKNNFKQSKWVRAISNAK